MGIGVCGVLKANGEFIECDYGKHGYLIRILLTERERKQSIYFSSPRSENSKRNKCSSVGFEDWGKGISEKQFEWIKNNENEFDDMQYDLVVKRILDGTVKINKGAGQSFREASKNELDLFTLGE